MGLGFVVEFPARPEESSGGDRARQHRACSHLVSGSRCGERPKLRVGGLRSWSNSTSKVVGICILRSLWGTLPSRHLRGTSAWETIFTMFLETTFNRCCLVCRDAASSFLLAATGSCALPETAVRIFSMSAATSAASSRRVVWCTKCGATHFESDAAQLTSG